MQLHYIKLTFIRHILLLNGIEYLVVLIDPDHHITKIYKNVAHFYQTCLYRSLGFIEHAFISVSLLSNRCVMC